MCYLYEKSIYYVSDAVDEFYDKSSHDWRPLPGTSGLCNVINEHYDVVLPKLYLFKDTVMALTANNNRPTRKTPKFSNGQLLLVEELPSEGNNYCVKGKLLLAGNDENQLDGALPIELKKHQFAMRLGLR